MLLQYFFSLIDPSLRRMNRDSWCSPLQIFEPSCLPSAVIQLLNCLASDKSFHSLMDRKLTPKFWLFSDQTTYFANLEKKYTLENQVVRDHSTHNSIRLHVASIILSLQRLHLYRTQPSLYDQRIDTTQWREQNEQMKIKDETSKDTRDSIDSLKRQE